MFWLLRLVVTPWHFKWSLSSGLSEATCGHHLGTDATEQKHAHVSL